MKRRSQLVGAWLSLLCLLQAPLAQARGPATRDERAKVVALARMLEQHPLDAKASAARQWLREWVIEVPDVRVAWCDHLLGDSLAHYRYWVEVNTQMMSSAAAYVVEHPEKNWKDVDMYRAGVEGSLRVYEALLRSRPDARSDLLDQLVTKRDQGELGAHVAQVAQTKCKKPNRDLLFTLAGVGVGTFLGLLVAWWFGALRTRRPNSSAPIPSTRAARNAPRFQNVVVFCAAYYVIVVALFHFLQPEMDPRFSFMSIYVWGAHGWLMVTTFFALGLGAFTVALGLRDLHQSTWGARAAFGVLSIGALFVSLAGVFKEFLPHLMASIVALPSLNVAVLLYTWSFRKSTQWEPVFGPTLFTALGMVAAFALIQVHVGPPGLLQRAFIFLFLVWLVIVVHRLVRVAASAAPAA